MSVTPSELGHYVSASVRHATIPGNSGTDFIVRGQYSESGRTVSAVNWYSQQLRTSTATATFVKTTLYTGTATAHIEGLTAADINSDGLADAIYVSDGLLQVRFQTSIGLFGNPITYTFSGGTPTASSVCAGDFDGNGFVDVAVLSAETDVVIFENDGTGVLVVVEAADISDNGWTPNVQPWVTSRLSLVCADFDGDGKSDFAAATGEMSIPVRVYAHNGVVYTTSSGTGGVNLAVVGLAAGNIDGDVSGKGVEYDDNSPSSCTTTSPGRGKSDLVVFYSNGTETSAQIHFSDRDGLMFPGSKITIKASTRSQLPSTIAVVDIDADGDQDIVVTNPTGGSYLIESRSNSGDIENSGACNCNFVPGAIGFGRCALTQAKAQGNVVTCYGQGCTDEQADVNSRAGRIFDKDAMFTGAFGSNSTPENVVGSLMLDIDGDGDLDIIEFSSLVSESTAAVGTNGIDGLLGMCTASQCI